MKKITKKDFLEFLTIVPGFIVFVGFGYLMYLTTRDEKVAEWKQPCEIVSINEITKKTITNKAENIRRSAVASFSCDFGPASDKRIYSQEFKDLSLVNITVGEKFTCSFEAWEVVNPGSIAGPGPITRYSQLKFNGCTKQ